MVSFHTMPETIPPDAQHPTVHDHTLSSMQKEMALLREENRLLKDRLAWFERQIFGQKSEKRLIENPLQHGLLTEPTQTAPAADVTMEVAAYTRGTAKKQRPDNCTTEAGLRFSDDVPVEVIRVTPSELTGPEADSYDIIDTHVTHKLAQQQASYIVLRYETPVFKHKDTNALLTAAMPDQVLDRSIADVSLLAGLLVDKFLYHLPLYRQHQRMANLGVTVSRASLMNWVKRTIELLRPIVEAQCRHILLSKVLTMDETPIKAGRACKGKLKQGYFWPLYGEDHEIVFTYSDSRGRRHIEETLKSQFRGTLLTDGYAAYARYVEITQNVIHAQCWAHCRRKFFEAQERDPVATQALEFIGVLYRVEQDIRDQSLTDTRKHQRRREDSTPAVDEFFTWCERQIQRRDLTPKHPLRKALHYALARQRELRVFLEDPDVPIDTNHLEREIRPIPLGRKNWLFCWTELGAEHVGLIQSLISTCRLQGVNAQTYLIDVLQRISTHPASRIEELTPRIWKEKFAEAPMRSVLRRHVNDVQE